MQKTTTNQLRWLWVTIIVLLIDQTAKWWINTHLELYQSTTVLPFLNITLQHNAGAAFGFLHDKTGWQRWLFAGIAIVVCAFILYWLSKMPRKDNVLALALTLVLGGAIGNLYDRITLTYVVDFIDFHIGNWHYATFNIADSAITVGIIIWLIRVCFFKDKTA